MFDPYICVYIGKAMKEQKSVGNSPHPKFLKVSISKVLLRFHFREIQNCRCCGFLDLFIVYLFVHILLKMQAHTYTAFQFISGLNGKG